jgi:hypothetical protein
MIQCMHMHKLTSTSTHPFVNQPTLLAPQTGRHLDQTTNTHLCCAMTPTQLQNAPLCITKVLDNRQATQSLPTCPCRTSPPALLRTLQQGLTCQAEPPTVSPLSPSGSSTAAPPQCSAPATGLPGAQGGPEPARRAPAEYQNVRSSDEPCVHAWFQGTVTAAFIDTQASKECSQ